MMSNGDYPQSDSLKEMRKCPPCTKGMLLLGTLSPLALLSPRYIDANFVPVHLSIKFIVDRHCVEEFPPNELRYNLTIEGLGGAALGLTEGVQ